MHSVTLSYCAKMPIPDATTNPQTHLVEYYMPGLWIYPRVPANRSFDVVLPTLTVSQFPLSLPRG
jgi:hypothetical protein